MRRNSFSKTGWGFPVVPTKGEQSLPPISFFRDIRESLTILFTTLPGDRIAHPHYGCDLNQYMFRPINTTLLTEMENTIASAIALFEVRISLESVKVTPDVQIEHQLNIHLIYQVRINKSRFDITIPFYTMEAH